MISFTSNLRMDTVSKPATGLMDTSDAASQNRSFKWNFMILCMSFSMKMIFLFIGFKHLFKNRLQGAVFIGENGRNMVSFTIFMSRYQRVNVFRLSYIAETVCTLH